MRFILQDANYNVVGLARECDATLIRQFRYEPYGQLIATEYGDGVALDLTDPSVSLEIFHGFQGREFDAITGLYDFRNRIYDPKIARFLQKDPNEQALALRSALAMNAQTMSVFATMSPDGQYFDSMHLYGFVGNNPNTGLDPSGLMSSGFDWFDNTGELSAEILASHVNAVEEVYGVIRRTYDAGATLALFAASLLPGADAVLLLQQFSAGDSIGIGDIAFAATSFLPGSGAAKAIGRLLGKFGQGRARYKAAKAGKQIWSTRKNRTSIKNAFEHWGRHGKDFPGLQNAKQYAEATWDFVTYPPAGTLTHVRRNGDTLFYYAASNTFAIINRDGIPRTMFKPIDKMVYWLNELAK